MPKKALLPFIMTIFGCFLLFCGFGPSPALAQSETPPEAAKTTGDLGLGGELGKAIASTPVGKKSGQINPEKEPGFLGIPGAPAPALWAGLLWAIWVGWIFSTVGAFGGVMAGVGHISIFGLADYAKSFQDTNAPLNKFLTDSIRVSNQFLVGLSALISTVNYARMKRIVAPLAIAMAIGSIAASYLIPVLPAGKISLESYVGYFGLCVFAIAGFMYYGTTARAARSRQASNEAARRFEESAKSGDDSGAGVKFQKFGMLKCVFTFY